MSKRYLKKLVEEKVVDGWNDPRMSTLSGIRRRGYPPEAIRDFCQRIGVAKSNSEVDMAMLEHCVRENLNENATRAMCVLNPLKLVIDNYPDGAEETVEIENNPQKEGAGTHKATFAKELYIEKEDFAVVPPPKYKRLTPGGVVRLKGSYIIRATGYDEENGEVKRVYAEVIEGSASGADSCGVKAKGVIHWVDAATAVDMTVNLYDSLLLPYDGVHEDFSERLNPNSRVVLKAKGEKMLGETAPLTSYQFVRTGYFCRDGKYEGVTFNQVVSLKDGYKK